MQKETLRKVSFLFAYYVNIYYICKKIGFVFYGREKNSYECDGLFV